MKSDRITNWPKEERPRERLLAEGADPGDVRQLTCYAGIVGRHSAIPSLAVFYPIIGAETPAIIQYRTWNDSRLCMVPVRVDKTQSAAETIPSGAWMLDPAAL